MKSPLQRFAFIVFVFCTGAHVLVAQKIDSLQTALQTTQKPEKKAEVLYELSQLHLDSATEKSISYAEQSLDQAKAANSHQWTTTAYHQLGRAYLRVGRSEEAGAIYQKALSYEVEVRPREDKKLAWVYYNVGNYYKHISNYKEAINYFEESLSLETQLANKENQASCLLNLGAMFQYLGENDTALYILNQASELARSTKDTSTLESIISNQALVYEARGEFRKSLAMLSEALEYDEPGSPSAAMTLANMGNSYYYMGQVDSTIYYYSQAIEIFEETGHENEYAMLALNMGVFLSGQGNYEEAIKNDLKAVGFFEKSGNKNYLSTAYLNLGSSYEKLGQPKESMSYFQKALAISLETGNKLNIATTYQNIGILLERKGDYKAALDYHSKSLALAQEMGDQKLVSETHLTLGGLYGKQKKYQQAESSFLEGLRIAENIGALAAMEKAYGSLVEVKLMSAGNEKAYEYYKLHLNIHDSLKSAKNHDAVQELQTKYQVREKEDSLKLQNAEIIRQELINAKNQEINKQRGIQLLISFVGLAIAIALGLLAFLNFRKKQAANEKLIEQNTVIEQKSKEKELLLGEIHHRVKNNLQMISSLLNLQQRGLLDAEAKKAINEGSGRVRSMALVHNMLYRNDEFSSIEIDEYVNRLADELISNLYPDSRIKLDLDIEKLKLDVDTAVPIGLILNELLTNTLKYAFEGVPEPAINVELKLQDKNLTMTYSDNGNVRQEILNQLDQAKSFGLRMIESLTQQLGGKKEMTAINGLHYRFTFGEVKTY